MTTIREVVEAIHAPKEPTLAEHVLNCTACVVSADGDTFYCREGARLAQISRKRRFWGGR